MKCKKFRSLCDKVFRSSKVFMSSDGFSKEVIDRLIFDIDQIVFMFLQIYYVSLDKGTNKFRKRLAYMWLGYWYIVLLSVRLLACLWTSLNALGSCQLRSNGIDSCHMTNNSINNIDMECPVGKRGITPSNIHPPVSRDAPCASSNPDIITISSTTKCVGVPLKN